MIINSIPRSYIRQYLAAHIAQQHYPFLRDMGVFWRHALPLDATHTAAPPGPTACLTLRTRGPLPGPPLADPERRAPSLPALRQKTCLALDAGTRRCAAAPPAPTRVTNRRDPPRRGRSIGLVSSTKTQNQYSINQEVSKKL